MSLEIKRFDVSEATPEELAAHVELAVAAMAADRPHDPLPGHDSVVAALSTGLAGRGLPQVWSAHLGGRLAGKGVVSHPMAENDHLSLIDMQVHPALRVRGIGTALLREKLPTIATTGRTLAASWNVVAETPAAAWAEQLGFRVAKQSVVQAVDFATVDRTLWEIAAPAGYRVEAWQNATPEGLVESFARARTAIEEAPLGDWSFQLPVWTVERVRQAEAELKARNVEQRIVAVVHEPTGDVAGMTELHFYSPEATLGYQADTVVLSEHRGHGLGAFLKAQMLGRVAADRPGTKRVHAGTDASNESALRMNRRVGYQVVRVAAIVEIPSAELVARFPAIGDQRR